MIEIRSGRLEPSRGTGQLVERAIFHFDRQVTGSWVSLTGYHLSYAGDDHHVRTISVDLSANVVDTDAGPGVEVKATLLLEDKNGDDVFGGWADYLLFVELGRRLVDGGEAPEPGAVNETGPEQKG
jgi:hypothetical protein